MGDCPTGDVGPVPAPTPMPTATSFTYTQEKDHTCGACGKSNAVRADGQNTWSTASRRAARQVCGDKCSMTLSCAGFVYKKNTGRCYYWKNITCGVRARRNHDCYTKVS